MPAVKSGRVHLVAAVRPEDGAEDWVNSSVGIAVLKMDKWHFNDGTPTLLMLNKQHKITRVIVGEVATNQKERAEVEASLQ